MLINLYVARVQLYCSYLFAPPLHVAVRADIYHLPIYAVFRPMVRTRGFQCEIALRIALKQYCKACRDLSSQYGSICRCGIPDNMITSYENLMRRIWEIESSAQHHPSGHLPQPQQQQQVQAVLLPQPNTTHPQQQHAAGPPVPRQGNVASEDDADTNEAAYLWRSR